MVNQLKKDCNKTKTSHSTVQNTTEPQHTCANTVNCKNPQTQKYPQYKYMYVRTCYEILSNITIYKILTHKQYKQIHLADVERQDT